MAFLLEFINSFGGPIAIVAVLFSFLQRMHLKRFENELNSTREKLNKILESEIHAKKKKFDKEFSIFEELWDLITNLERETHQLLSIMENDSHSSGTPQIKAQAKSDYIKFYNDTNYKVRKIAPFVPDELYEEIGKKLGSFKMIIECVEVHGNESEYLQQLDNDITMIRGSIAQQIKSHFANV